VKCVPSSSQQQVYCDIVLDNYETFVLVLQRFIYETREEIVLVDFGWQMRF
jgi:hypothetical protein